MLTLSLEGPRLAYYVRQRDQHDQVRSGGPEFLGLFLLGTASMYAGY